MKQTTLVKKHEKIAFLLRGTPSLLMVLGAGFVMASSTDLRAALAMGGAVLVAMVLSSITVVAIHKAIPPYAKVPAYLLIITGFVTLIHMLMQAFFPTGAGLLGVHLATLSVSAVVFRDTEEVADHEKMGISVLTAFVTGLFFTAVMVVCALIREPLGSASICGQPISFLEGHTLNILSTPFGGYLILALVLATINAVTGLHEHDHHAHHRAKMAEGHKVYHFKSRLKTRIEARIQSRNERRKSK